MQTSYDIVIVGARVAGSSLATLLGEAGYSVLLVDRATFPSDTLSTHYFRGSGCLGMLKRLGVLEEALATGAPPLHGAAVYQGGAAESVLAEPDGPGEVGYSLSVRRSVLDDMLVRRAQRQPGVTVLSSTRFQKAVWRDGRVVGAILETGKGPLEINCTLLVGADGRLSTVAKAVEAVEEVVEPPIRDVAFVYVQDYECLEVDGGSANEYSELENEIMYVFPSDANVACVAFSAGLDDFGPAWLKSEEFFARHAERHAGIISRYSRCRPISKMLRCKGEASWIRTPVGPGWALVGDAAVHQDPWSGRGMDMAANHAAFLAESIDDWFSGRMEESVAMTNYHSRRTEHALPIFWDTQNGGRDLRLHGK